MAGIKGQPAPKPSDVPSPIPDSGFSATDLQLLSENFPGEASSSDAQLLRDNFSDTGSQPENAGYTGPGAGMIKGVSDALPTVGAIAGGGVFGAATMNPAAGVAGAMMGAAAGTGLKNLIEDKVFGNPTTRDQYYDELIKETGWAGLGEATGFALPVAAKAVKNSKGGQAVADMASKIVQGPKEYISGLMKAAKDKVELPLMNILNTRVSNLDARQSGDAVKELITGDLSTRFGKYHEASKALNEVTKQISIPDDARLSLFKSGERWGVMNVSLDNQKLMRTWLNKLIEGNNLAQFDSVRRDLSRAISEAAETYGEKSMQVKTLQKVKEQANIFLGDQMEALAKRISSGTASMDEMNAFGQMMQRQANPTVAADPKNLLAYAKSVSRDFLKERKKVAAYYSDLRGLLDDVGEQTRVRSEGVGVESFLESINDVPSEKLVERMWDMKNSRALEKMQKEMPEVFQHVREAKMNQVLQQATSAGDVDITKIQKIVEKMPPSTRKMLMSDEEMKVMNEVVSNPRRRRLDILKATGDDWIGKWAARVAETAVLSGEAAKPVVKKAFEIPGIRQIPGRAVNTMASPLVNAFAPESLRAPNPEE